MMTYSSDKFNASNLETIHKDRVFEVISMNRKGKKPLKLIGERRVEPEKETSYQTTCWMSITRFDNDRSRQPRKEEAPEEKNRQQRSAKKECKPPTTQ